MRNWSSSQPRGRMEPRGNRKYFDASSGARSFTAAAVWPDADARSRRAPPNMFARPHTPAARRTARRLWVVLVDKEPDFIAALEPSHSDLSVRATYRRTPDRQA